MMPVSDEYDLEGVGTPPGGTDQYMDVVDPAPYRTCTAVLARDVSDSMRYGRTPLTTKTLSAVDAVLRKVYDETEMAYLACEHTIQTVDRYTLLSKDIQGGGLQFEDAYDTITTRLEEAEGDTYVFMVTDDDLHPHDSATTLEETMRNLRVDLHAYLAIDPDEHDDSLRGTIPSPREGTVQCHTIRDEDDMKDALKGIVNRVNTLNAGEER